MNWKFWQWDLWTYRIQIQNWKALRACAVEQQEEHYKSFREARDKLDAVTRQRDQERENAANYRANYEAVENEFEALQKEQAVQRAIKSAILTAPPMTEAKLVECFAGGRDHPLFLGACQVVDASFDALGHEARDGKNTEKQTNMLLGGQEALVNLKANLLDYVARAAVQEQMVGAGEGRE